MRHAFRSLLLAASALPLALPALAQTTGLAGMQQITHVNVGDQVLVYRQGQMNVIINAHGAGPAAAAEPATVRADAPVISAIALRVRDASSAFRHALDRGAWAVPTRVEVMELNIPAIHGVGSSRIYFVDRYREFSIYDVDFTPIPTVELRPPALGGLHWYGVVQYIGVDRMDDWTEFYAELFGIRALPDDERQGILPKGRVLRSPCGKFFLQLIEPEPGMIDLEGEESLCRVALATPDVLASVETLRQRGVEFVESAGVQPGPRGAVTRTYLQGALFELVHAELAP